MNFDPNDKHRPKIPQWGTYIPDRRSGGKFKIHATLGHAKNAFHCARDAFHCARDAILYEWIPHEDWWVERFRIEGFKTHNAPCPNRCGNNTHSAGWTGMVFALKPCYRCDAEERRAYNG